MAYELEISENLDKIFFKLAKKDRLQFEILSRKLKEIVEDPYRFKPLTGNMAGQRRTHIRNFVLTFKILENQKIIQLLDYAHHDLIYGN